ncbi:MAG: ABC transporter ATP-binding protein [Pseudomonadota bacterium]
MTALATRDLSVVFGRGAEAMRAVSSVSIEVPRGAAFGLIGESGSGKSTVLRAVSGLNLSYTGSVTIDGAEAERPRGLAFFRRVQMVFQDPYGSLHPRKLVRDALLEPLRIHRIPDGEQRMAEVLDAVDLPREFAYRFPHQLSGGQRQRVAIARCLILEPEILLLDEPTSALDVSVQAGVLNLLKRLQEERGLTYLMVSHDLAVVTHICSDVAVMTNGEIVETLPADDIRNGAARHSYARELLTSARSVGAL